MEVPRTLWHTNVYYVNQPGEGHICEAGDVEAAVLMAPAGTMMEDAEAKRLGITDYLETHPAPEAPAVEPEAKAVEQAAVEDKAVAPEETKAEAPEPAGEPAEGTGPVSPESRRRRG